MNIDVLKPCPFCGKEAKIAMQCWCQAHEARDYYIEVSCKTCGAMAGYQQYSLGSNLHETVQSAINEWNTRTENDLHIPD